MYFILNTEIVCKCNEIGNTVFFYNLITHERCSIESPMAQIAKSLVIDCCSIEKAMSIYGNALTDKCIEYMSERKFGKIHENITFVPTLRTINPVIITNERFHQFRLKRLVLEITGDCNFNCHFCTEDAVVYRTCGCKKWDSHHLLTTENYKSIILDAIKLGVERIDFVGGEPLKRWDLLSSLIDFIYGHNICVSVFSNGSLIGDKEARFFKEKNVTVILQLIGFDTETYDNTTSSKGMFESVRLGIQNMDANGVKYILHLIISQFNESKVEQVKADLAPRRVEEVYIYPTNDYSSTLYYEKMMHPATRDIEVDLFTYQLSENINNCLYGQIFVSSDGLVSPCMMLRDVLGDLKEKALWEIFYQRNHRQYWNLPKSEIQHCKKCERNFVCFDCRALDAFASNKIDGMKFCNRVLTKAE